MRAMCALELSQPEKIPDAFAAVYQAGWVERQRYEQPEVFGKVFEELLGVDAGKEVMGKVCDV